MSSTVFFHLQLTSVLLVTLQTQGSAAVKVVDMSGATYDTKWCRDKADEYTKKGDYCAVLFENAACDTCTSLLGFKTGWDRGIESGKVTFSKLGRYREDSESVIVAPGCIFIGYDESDESDDNKRTIATAIGRNDWVYKDFKVLLIKLKFN